MFHLPRRYDVLGNPIVLKDTKDPIYKYFSVMFDKCKRFLTPEQLKTYYSGKDVYISPEQMNRQGR
jgi:hypothetical protein